MPSQFLKERLPKLLTIMAALLSIVVGFYSTFDSARSIKVVNLDLNESRIKTLIEEAKKAKNETSSINVQLQKNFLTLPKKSQTAIQVKVLQQKINAIDVRLAKLESAIMASPSKALEIPLLQRDLDNLKTAQQSSLAAVKEGVDRIYDLNKWLLGALAVSIVTLAVANFLKGREVPGNTK
jgi:hypothetical protein